VHFDVRRWGVFNLVGFGGFVLQLATVAALTRGFGWSGVVATAIALEVAAAHNFVGHTWWTWRSRRLGRAGGWARRFVKYQAAKTTSLVASLATACFFIWSGTPPEIANLAAVLLCSIPNYLLAENYVFASERRSQPVRRDTLARVLLRTQGVNKEEA
jgi:putative flippase GtrA